ncbi:Josephin-like protein [Fragariocoptes setiger]|uniref:ubiquitinyl hydrolase 1 n=1 Tax=Fragariocoptes setiger TaxID=1670756 RepID=A0ABQ7S6R6_9ACAR|nr:Josephin-like protein [Fragariocoptes setiger]
MPVGIYHERQSRQLCALHALNNLFQDPRAFTKNDLDLICKALSPRSRILNPHRSVLGLGCYDVNVIISALAKKSYEVIWFDKRKDPSCLRLDNIFGFILNVPNPLNGNVFTLPLSYFPIPDNIWSSRKHWIAVRKIGTNYFDLDSKLVEPAFIGDGQSLVQYLRTKNLSDQVEILIIVDKPTADAHAWENIDSPS